MVKKVVIIVLSLSIVVGFLFWRFGPKLTLPPKPAGPIILTYWGFWQDDNLIRPVLASFQAENPNVKVNYVRQSLLNFRIRVQTQIREGVGPDVLRIHNSWLPMFEADLAPAPSDVFTLSEYQSAFYPVAQSAFIKGGQILAAPIGIDGLALYINVELLAAVGAAPPKSWREFIDSAVKMTVKDESGQIKTAGAALGTASNVDHWPDIVGLLFLQQPGAGLANLTNPTSAEVLRFYTGFVTDPSKKTWDVNLPPSTQMFAEGRLGFYFAPSVRANELRQANPNLKFKVAPLPQLSQNQVGWASFWGEAVSKKSQYQKEAWQLVKFLTSVEAQKLLYQQATSRGLIGEPYSRIDLAGELINDPIMGAFVAQGPIYKFWYLSSNTLDSGINDEMIKYFEDGINATLAGTDPQVALQTVDRGVKQVLEKYTKTPAQ